MREFFIPAAFMLISIPLAYFLSGRFGAIWAGAGGLCLFILVGAYELNHYLDVREEKALSPQPANFHIGMPVVYSSPGKNLVTDIMLGYALSGREIVSPVNFALFFHITNISSRHLKITGYSVEVAEHNTGPWIPLLPMRIENHYKIYMTAADLTRAHEVKSLDGILDWVISKNSFQPDEARTGWAFFQQHDLTASEIKHFKVQIHDTIGIVSKQIISLSEDSPPATRGFLNPRFEVLAIRDISKFQFRYYHSSR